MGYKIFVLCLRQLRNNIGVAFQLCWFWALVYIAIVVVFVFTSFLTSPDLAKPTAPPIAMIPFVIIIVVVTFVSFSTIAIGWHRLVLREETPNSFYVLRPEWPIGSYFWNTIKITFAILIMMIPILFIILYPLSTVINPWGVVDNNSGFSKVFLFQIAIQLIFGVVGTWLFLRIGTVLPALAVKKRMTLRESFQLTSSISGELVITAFWVVLLQIAPLLIQFLLAPIAGSESLLLIGVMLVANIVFAFISFFVGFGVLTVVYGHLAENKPI